MSKLTNKKLQEVKHKLYAVYIIGDDGRRCGAITGCNIVRAMEEAENKPTLIFSDELENARVPRVAFDSLEIREGNRDIRAVGMWLLELESARKRRATWQEIESLFNLARKWLKENPTGGQQNG